MAVQNPVAQAAQLAELDHALFEGSLESKVEGVIATFHENERPLGGLAGHLDWRFHGLISQRLAAGVAEGKAGECVYLPVTRDGKTFHLILIGAGASEKPGLRTPLGAGALKTLQKNLASLNLGKLALSRSDFGNMSDEAILPARLKGVSVWIAP